MNDTYNFAIEIWKLPSVIFQLTYFQGVYVLEWFDFMLVFNLKDHRRLRNVAPIKVMVNLLYGQLSKYHSSKLSKRQQLSSIFIAIWISNWLYSIDTKKFLFINLCVLRDQFPMSYYIYVHYRYSCTLLFLDIERENLVKTIRIRPQA